MRPAYKENVLKIKYVYKCTLPPKIQCCFFFLFFLNLKSEGWLWKHHCHSALHTLNSAEIVTAFQSQEQILTIYCKEDVKPFCIATVHTRIVLWGRQPRAELTLPEQSWCLETAVFSVLPHSTSLLYQHSALHIMCALEMTDVQFSSFNKGQHLF